MSENVQEVAIDARPKRIRRVGAVTMGVSLIGTGIVSIICLINQNFDVIQITRFSPIMLVLLGIEFIVANFRKEQEYVKYDFFSILMCFVLIFAVMAMTAGIMSFQYFIQIKTI